MGCNWSDLRYSIIAPARPAGYWRAADRPYATTGGSDAADALLPTQEGLVNSHSKSKGHPAFATAPAEGVTVVLQCAPALPPAGQDAGCAQSPLPISSKATVSGGRGRTCSCCAAAATYLLWRTCRRDGQRYLATKYLHSLADGEKGLRKAIVLLRENMAAKNQAALRKLEGAGNGA